MIVSYDTIKCIKIIRNKGIFNHIQITLPAIIGINGKLLAKKLNANS